MRNRIHVAAAAALAVVVALMAAGWVGRAQAPAKRTWEYKVVSAQFIAPPASISDQEMNRLGAEGWELAGTRSVEFAQGALMQYRTDYFFKRPR